MSMLTYVSSVHSVVGIMSTPPPPLVHDPTISTAHLLRPRITLLRLDILPFLLIYAILAQMATPAIEYSWREMPSTGVDGNTTR